MVKNVMRTQNKKAYFKCTNCDKPYYTGVLVDDIGNLLLDDKQDNPGTCPLCGTHFAEASEIEVLLKTIKIDLTENTDTNSALLETFKHPTQKQKLKIPCPYCAELRVLSSKECEHCGKEIVLGKV